MKWSFFKKKSPDSAAPETPPANPPAAEPRSSNDSLRIGGIKIEKIEERSNPPKKWITVLAERHEEEKIKLDTRTAFELLSKALLSRGHQCEGVFRRTNHFDISLEEAPNLTVEVVRDIVKDLQAQYPDAASLQKYRESEARRIEQVHKENKKRWGK